MKLKDIVKEGWVDDLAACNQPELAHASPQEQLAAIKKNANAIQNIKNPTREMQRIAIEKQPTIIAAMKNHGTHFDEDMLLLAISHNGFVIGSIDDPSEEMQMTAIKDHIGTISSIVNPTPRVVKFAFSNPQYFLHDHLYDTFKHEVARIFADNTLLMKKWLRYGEAMRMARYES
ncbi:hypothetical protein M0R04_07710 [Candidatus Dojkabacteria bacterium]|jgi:hypothetical protein|nr:hypothetical protein [Candidatus Dojkabacteria bacterium]